ncbi:MAG: lamin tail domain-containing protein, partial [Phycisphaerae bacterium]
MKRVALTVEGGCPILEALETRLLLSTTYVAADALIDDDCARPSEEIQSAHAAADADEESLLLQGGTLQRDGLPQRKAAPTVVISEVDTGGTDWIEFTNVSTTSVNISGWQITWYDWNSYPAPQGTFTIPGRTVCAVGETFVLTEQGTVPGTYPNFYTGANISWNNNLSGNEVVVLLQDGSGDVVDVMCAVDGDPAAITSPISIPPIEWMGPPVSANTNTALTYQRIGSADHNDASDWTAAAPSPGTVNPALSLPFMPPEVLISEVDTGSTDWVEFTNVSAVAMDVSGWQITWYDWNSYPAPGGTFTIPKKTICAAGETFVLTDGGTAPGTYPNFYTGTNIWWNNSASGNEVVVLLQDDSGGVMDVMCAVDGYPAAISSPVSIPATEWQSSPVPAKANTAATYQRVGFADNDNASDWIVAEPSPGAVNSGLEIPFPRNLDFGDAPSPYPTTRASDGARHAVTGPSLGANRDDEADGRPTTAADGDDITGAPDDEDGVAFGSTIMVGQLGAGLT